MKNIQNKRLLRLWLAMTNSSLLMSLRGVPKTFGMTKQSIKIRFLSYALIKALAHTLGMILLLFVLQAHASENPPNPPLQKSPSFPSFSKGDEGGLWIAAEGEGISVKLSPSKTDLKEGEEVKIFYQANADWTEATEVYVLKK